MWSCQGLEPCRLLQVTTSRSSRYVDSFVELLILIMSIVHVCSLHSSFSFLPHNIVAYDHNDDATIYIQSDKIAFYDII